MSFADFGEVPLKVSWDSTILNLMHHAHFIVQDSVFNPEPSKTNEVLREKMSHGVKIKEQPD